MIRINTANGQFRLPVSVNEIDTVNLITMVEHVNLAPYYCLVCLCYSTDLLQFCIASNNVRKGNGEATVRTIPLLAKISEEYASKLDISVGDRLLLERSTIERGIHVNIGSCIEFMSFENELHNNRNLINYLLGTKMPIDEYNIYDTLTKKLISPKDTGNIILLGFKIIPVNAITGFYKRNCLTFDPFWQDIADGN